MNLYTSPENQKLLWDTISKVNLFQSIQSDKNQWFQRLEIPQSQLPLKDEAREVKVMSWQFLAPPFPSLREFPAHVGTRARDESVGVVDRGPVFDNREGSPVL